MTFELVFMKRDSEFELRMENLRFVAVDGKPVANDDDAAAAVAAFLGELMPSFRVSADGKYAGTLGDVVESSLMLVEAIGGDETVLDRVRTMMRSPQVRATLVQKAGDYWNTWAGVWTGLHLAPGKHVDRPAQFQLLGGKPLPVQERLSHEGKILGTDDRSLILLSYRVRIDGPAARQWMTEVLRQASEQAGNPPLPDDTIKSFTREAITKVALEPSTGRPHRARTDVVGEVNGKQRIEILDTVFHWESARGCAR